MSRWYTDHVGCFFLISRDLYYRDPSLFLKQSVVDRYIDDLAFTLGVSRASLNVVSLSLGK